MKVLITGATGLIGSKIAESLRAQNIQIHYLSTQKNKLNSASGYKGFFWDPPARYIDSACFEGVDTILHLAGASIAKPWTAKHKKQIYSSRIETANLILQALEASGKRIKTFVAASAIGVYPSSLTATYEEQSPFEVQADNFLQQIVVSWEEAAKAFAAVVDHLAIIRIGLVFTPIGGVLGSLSLPVKMGIGGPIGSGKQWQSWIHIDDLVSIFTQALTQNWEGVYNATAPTPCTQKALLLALGKQLRRPIWMPPVPAFVLKLLMGARSSLVLSSQKVIPKALTEKQFDFRFKHVETALQDIFKR